MREQLAVSCSYEISRWIATPPPVCAVRPAHCPRCHAPSRPVGDKLGLWGHGHRTRRLRGPLRPDGPVCDVTVQARRFLCRSCLTVILVVPGGVLPGRRYTATAIARSLALVGCGVGTAAMAREQIGQRHARDWPSLRRWCRQVRQGTVLSGRPRAWRWSKSLPRQAYQIAAHLAAHAPAWFAWHTLAEQAEVGATWITGAPARWYPPAPRPTNQDQVRVIARESTTTTTKVHGHLPVRSSELARHRAVALAHLARDAL